MAESPTTSKKKVLALPIDEDGETKVLLLEPGRRRSKIKAPSGAAAKPAAATAARPAERAKATAVETGAPTAEDAAGPAHPDAPKAEPEAEPKGLFGRIKGRIPVGRGKGADPEAGAEDEEPAAAEPATVEEAEPEEVDEEADGPSPQAARTSKAKRFSLPFGRGKKAKEDAPEEGETEAAEDAEAEPEAEPEPARAEARAVEAAESEGEEPEAAPQEETAIGGLLGRLPFGRKKDAEAEAETPAVDEAEAEAPQAAEEEETEEPAEQEKKGGLLGRLPFGRRRDKKAEEAPEGPAEVEEKEEVGETVLQLGEAALALEDMGEPAPAVTEAQAEAAEEIEPAAAPAAVPAEVARPAAETARPPEADRPLRLDPAAVERIHYNVDMAIYRNAATAGASGTTGTRVDPGAVDRLLATAAVPADAGDGGTTSVAGGPSRSGRPLPSTQRSVADIAGLDPGTAEALLQRGVETVTDLVEADAIGLAVDAGLRISDVQDWQRTAEILHLEAVRPGEAHVLTRVGIHRIDVLAEQDPEELAERVRQYVRFREPDRPDRGEGGALSVERARQLVEAAGRAGRA